MCFATHAAPAVAAAAAAEAAAPAASAAASVFTTASAVVASEAAAEAAEAAASVAAAAPSVAKQKASQQTFIFFQLWVGVSGILLKIQVDHNNSNTYSGNAGKLFVRHWD